MGQWRLHVPNRKALDVVVSNNITYAAFTNGLLEYDQSANESSLWTSVNGLSDLDISCLGKYDGNGAVFIGYVNGNIDKIEGNTVTNIPAIRIAQIQGNKQINKIVQHGSFLYLATGFSVVVLDPLKSEVRDTYYPTSENSPVLDIAFRGDSIFALTATKMLKGSLSNAAIAHPSQWSLDTRLDILSTHSYKDFEIIQDEMFVLFKHDAYGMDSVFHITPGGNIPVEAPGISWEINSLENSNDNRLILNSEGTINFHNLDHSVSYSISGFGLGGNLTPLNSFYDSGVLWIADKDLGLGKVPDQFTRTLITFNGPPKNEFYSLDWEKDKLVVAGGGLTSMAHTYSGSGIYTMVDEEWTLNDRDNTSLWTNQLIYDFLAVSIDPTNNDKIAIGTYSEIPLSISENGVITDTFTPLNSTLEYTMSSNNSMITDLQYDASGNLWIVSGFSSEPLHVYTKGGEWYSFDCGPASLDKFTRRITIDNDGNKWFAAEGAGLFGYKDSDTPDNPADDQQIQLNTGTTTGALPSNTVNALAVDFDNELWIGTDNGFAILYNANSAFGALPGDYNAQRIKIEFEGNVEYVLGNTNITDIEVDGGNRKWFGTANSGLILLSPDGQEVIYQFTSENSPLISNNILDLEIDHNTGEIFIITDKGLVSYRSDATYGDPNYDNVTVFPNPARPDFDGPITIQGIRYDSDVKITDVAGNLVYQTTSNGGTATWNGRTLKGDRVTTGVYLIWTAPNEGKGRKVGKVLVVH